MIVPKTALIATTISEAIRVSSSERTACGEVTWSQKWLRPELSDSSTRAASGIRTIRLRYRTTYPRPRPAPTPGRRMPARGTLSWGGLPG